MKVNISQLIITKSDMPLYFEAVKNSGAILTGVELFPTTFTVAPAAVAVGMLVEKFAAYRWAVWAGWFLATLGFGIQYLLDVHTSTVAWIFITLVAGVGTGMLYPSLTFSIQAATPNKDQAYAVSLYSFFRSAGQAVGVAVGGTIFQNSVKREILKYPSIAAHASEWAADSTELVEILKAMPPSLARTDLVQSYADALKIIWIVMCGLCAVAFIASFWTQHFDLNRELETDHGFKHDAKSADVEEGH
jgi:MFS family permease